MAEFKRRAWGNQSAAPASATTVNSFRDNSSEWNISVKSAKYSKNNDLGFKLSGFQYKDLVSINKLNPGLFFVKQGIDKNIWMWVKSDKLDEFMAYLPQLEDFLKSTKHYKESSIKTFGEKVLSYATNLPTEQEVQDNEKKVATNWRELLNSMNDPEVRKKFLAFQTTVTCHNRFSDAALSPNNVIEVLAADPDATFVTDASTWRSKYNRDVMANAPFVIITKVENTIPKEVYNDPEVIKAGGWNALVKKSGGPFYGEAYSAIKRARKNSSTPLSYMKSKAYDVRFTIPRDPNNDPFMTIANLVNNLTGEINAAAKEILRLEAIENGLEPMDYDAKKEGLETDADTLAFKDFILKKCEKSNIKISDVGDAQDVIANAVYAYAYEKSGNFNMLSPKIKTAFASAVCYAIALTFNIQSAKIAQCAKSFEKLTDDDANEMVMGIYGTYKELANFSLKEDINDGNHIMSFEELKDVLLSLTRGKKNKIKSELDDLTNRMNSL